MGGPALKPMMQRSNAPRSSGPKASRPSNVCRRSPRARASSLRAGIFPSGGSTTSDVRRSSPSDVPRSYQKLL